MKLISLERELEGPALEDDDEEYEFEEEELVDQPLYTVHEEQDKQLMMKVEVQKDFVKISDKIIGQEEEERIRRERLEDFNACMHGRRRYECPQCKHEQEIYSQLEILPLPSLNVTPTVIES